MQEPPYLSKTALICMWFRMVFPNSSNLDIQRFSLTLTCPPTKYQYLIGITISIPMACVFIPLLMLIIATMHSPIYQTNIVLNVCVLPQETLGGGHNVFSMGKKKFYLNESGF